MPTQQLRHTVKPEPEIIIVEVPVYIGKAFSDPVFKNPETWNDPSDYNPSYHGEAVPVDNIKSFSSSNIRSTGGYSSLNITPPTVTGIVRIGYTLTSTTGVWSAGGSGFTYKWKRDGVVIVGATSSTYIVTSLDIGPLITSEVTAYIGLVASLPSDSSNSASTYWRNILLAKPGIEIFDGQDPICTDNTAVYGYPAIIKSIKGTTLANQPVPANRAYLYWTRELWFDGVSHFYPIDGLASKFNGANTFIIGYNSPENSTTAIRTMLSVAESTSTGALKQMMANYSRYSAPDVSRMKLLYGDDTTTAEVDMTSYADHTQLVAFRTNSSPSYNFRVDKLFNPLVQVGSTQVRPVTAAPNYTLGTIGARRIGATPTISQYWKGNVKHFAIDNSYWSDAELKVYRLCAVAAGVI